MEPNKRDPGHYDRINYDSEVMKSFRKLCLNKIKELSDRHAMEAFAKDPGPVSTKFYHRLKCLALSNEVPLLGNGHFQKLFT